MPDISSLGPAAAAVIIVLLFLKYISGKDASQEKRDRKFADSMDSVAKSMRQVARETKKGNEEAKQRNGHLGEQNVQITQLINKSHEDIVEAMKDMKVQHVDVQRIEKQTVKLSEPEK